MLLHTTRHDTSRHDATRRDTTRHIMFPVRRVFRLRVGNVGMGASLAPAKGCQIMICDLGGGQKAKKERVLTKSGEIS